MKSTVVLTGIKPTGTPHIGNYFGAIKPALSSAETNAFFFIADYHALTTVKCAKEMKTLVHEIVKTWLACGLDPNKVVFYRQSDVPEIFELAVILHNVTPKGLMDRAHAYKAAVQEGENINMGLYNYPILMAADILLFNTNFVPVGQDQKQHIEIAADIARAFNAIYGNVLTVPEPRIKPGVAIVPGLDGRKMSKSYGNIIPLFADEAELLKCIKRITTDSSAPTDPKPLDHPLFQIYKLFGKTDIVTTIGWGQLKQDLFETANAYLKPIREKYQSINYADAEKLLTEGAIRARKVAQQTLARVKTAIGIM
jgi:tryptophanyl-tRNA synthetase